MSTRTVSNWQRYANYGIAFAALFGIAIAVLDTPRWWIVMLLTIVYGSASHWRGYQDAKADEEEEHEGEEER